MINIEKPESIGYQSSIEKGFDVLGKGGPGSGSWDAPGSPRFAHEDGNIVSLKAIFGEALYVVDETSKVVQEHLEDLSKFSPEILKKLSNAGVSVYVGDKTSVVDLDDNGKMKGVTPRGYPLGSTWDNVAGSYNQDKSQICAGSGLDGSASLIAHEVGHAIMHKILTGDQIGKLQDIQEKHHRDLKGYFQQGGKRGIAGVEEMFAEAVATNISSQPGIRKSYGQMVRGIFTREFASDMNKFFKENNVL